MSAFTEQDRITILTIGEAGVQAPTPELEQDMRVAEFELLEQNGFRLLEPATPGPYRAAIRLGADALTLEVGACGAQAAPPLVIRLGSEQIDAAVEDYRSLCDAYVRAVRELAPSQIERLDAERREAHREGAEAIRAALAPAATADEATSRRFFTVVAALAPWTA